MITLQPGRPRNQKVYAVALNYLLARRKPYGYQKQLAYANGIAPSVLE